MTVAVLAAAAVAPAAAQGGPSDDRGSGNQIVLHRDGERAVPFEAVVGGGQPALPRDGSQAVPFVAEVGPQTGPADPGFQWGDALIGAGFACALMMLSAGALRALRRHRPGPGPIGQREAPTRAAAH
jgi:hypothetical protein